MGLVLHAFPPLIATNSLEKLCHFISGGGGLSGSDGGGDHELEGGGSGLEVTDVTSIASSDMVVFISTLSFVVVLV